jgi:hypothetical protein
MAFWYIFTFIRIFFAIWNILWSFGIFFGKMQQEKSGNPAFIHNRRTGLKRRGVVPANGSPEIHQSVHQSI